MADQVRDVRERENCHVEIPQLGATGYWSQISNQSFPLLRVQPHRIGDALRPSSRRPISASAWASPRVKRNGPSARGAKLRPFRIGQRPRELGFDSLRNGSRRRPQLMLGDGKAASVGALSARRSWPQAIVRTGASPGPRAHSRTLKSIPRPSISASRSAACFFHPPVPRTRKLGSRHCPSWALSEVGPLRPGHRTRWPMPG
jgi:hypothetical protein